MEEGKIKYKGGRPPKIKEEKQDYKEVSVYFNKKQYEIIQEKAEKLNCSISEYMRQSALDVKILEKRELKEVLEIKSQLRKMGANVNQIARKMNQNVQTSNVFLKQDIEKIKEKLSEILTKL